ncbi:hypothetical protein [Antrihabitans sp. YC2-6]|uniref:hypothetical protein n=1 Tax=Antrihabitans sp. YC2-6 TaxID=2799498 RepID=UPI0018F575F4|nr:hypothetical protein [Antrihabitans sp. YC2-6]MBJ8348487.1 hypothetical protein [Antrihabitans sp. YC2-6]
MHPSATAFSIDRPRAAFAEAATRLRRLSPDYPRVYAVAAMAEQGKRRWWGLQEGLDSGRVDLMYRRATAEMSSVSAAADVVATSLIHAVIGRVVASLVLDGRAWDPGIENLSIHLDSDGGIDWAGVDDTTIRLLPDDSLAGQTGTVTVPCEQALALWTAHRSMTALDAIYERLSMCADLDYRRFWGIVGEAVVGAATYVPMLGSAPATVGMRRGQAVLDAIANAGRPVRGVKAA